LDYEDGMTIEQLKEFFVATGKHAVERQKTEVAVLQTAIAGLFDSKIINRFNDMLGRLVHTLDDSLGEQKFDRRAAMTKSMAELSKLNALLTSA
jgi:hypothetical protein